MPAPLDPRVPTPPVVGLLATVTPQLDASPRWAAGPGFSVAPHVCDSGGVEDPCGVAARTAGTRPASLEGNGFMVWADDACSAIDYGGTVADLVARAQAALRATESKRIAEELWTGTVARASGWSNAYLAHADSDTVTAGAATPVVAMACLEQYLADCAGGQQGMIHAPRLLVAQWAGVGLVKFENGRMVTPLQTLVVPDAGYDGSGPGAAPGDPPVPAAAGSVWAYATSVVEVRVGPVTTTPASPTDLAQVLDRTLNDYVVYAQRAALVRWDGCCHGAAQVDIPVCAIGGA